MSLQYHWFQLGESLIDSDYRRAIASFENAGADILEQAHKQYLVAADKEANNGCNQTKLKKLIDTLEAIAEAQDGLLLKELAGEAS